MSDQVHEVLEHVRTPATWLRILFMLGFCVILYPVSMVVVVLTLAQALFVIFTGSDNQNLRRLGAALAEYVGQVLRFLTYSSELRPFPFSPFPEVATTATAESGDSPESAADPVADGAAETATPPPKRSRSRRGKSGDATASAPGLED